MAMSPKIKMMTIEEWRDLGFFYDYIKQEKCWLFIGSEKGIFKLYNTIKEYCQNPRNGQISEHYHLGPYMYLKIVTWNEPIINENGIYGSLEDLSRLADIIKTYLDKTKSSDTIEIDEEYSCNNNSKIRILFAKMILTPQVLTHNLLKVKVTHYFYFV